TLAQADVARRQAALDRAEQRRRERQNSPVHVNVENPNAATSAATTPAPTPPPLAPPAAGPSAAPPTPPAPGGDLSDDNGPVTLDDVLKKIARENVSVDGRGWLSPQMRAKLANPPLFYNNLQEAASRWGFLLVPLSLPFIAFLFLFKKNITLYDH